MKAKMKIHLKLFLATGVPYGILTGLIYLLLFGPLTGLIAGLFAGILFGGFMSLILGSLHTWSVKRLPFKSREVMDVHHVQSIEMKLPYDKVFDLCIESLRLIRKCKIVEENRSQGKIIARTGTTWKSWGEVITFDIRKMNDVIQVKVSSRPAVRTTLVDYGKNLENVEKIVSFLKEHAN
jgi:hypothetical protein